MSFDVDVVLDGALNVSATVDLDVGGEGVADVRPDRGLVPSPDETVRSSRRFTRPDRAVEVNDKGGVHVHGAVDVNDDVNVEVHADARSAAAKA